MIQSASHFSTLHLPYKVTTTQGGEEMMAIFIAVGKTVFWIWIIPPPKTLSCNKILKYFPCSLPFSFLNNSSNVTLRFLSVCKHHCTKP